MPCHPDDHLFWPGTAADVAEVAEVAARNTAKGQLRRHWPCAVCKEQVDLLTGTVQQHQSASELVSGR